MRPSRLVESGLVLAASCCLCGCAGELDDPEQFLVDHDASTSACEAVVTTLFEERCANSVCHGTDSDLNLDLQASGLPSRLVDTAGTGVCSNERIIASDDPERSLLYAKLTEAPPCGDPMPLGAAPGDVPEEDRQCVLEWIRSAVGDAGVSPPVSSMPSDGAASAMDAPSSSDAPAATVPDAGSIGPVEPTTLDPTTWTASASLSSADEPPNLAVDGDTTTRWSSGQMQTGGEWFELDLGGERSFSRIVLDATGSDDDYARGYEVYVTNDSSAFGTPIATGTGSTVTTISFTEQQARYVRIVQTGTTDASWWSIHELGIYR